MDWQSIITLIIIVFTVLIFLIRLFKKDASSCGHDCKCSTKDLAPTRNHPEE